MAKRHVHSVWSRVKHFSPWYLLAASLITGLVCVNALRHNNLQMVKLRNDVFTADKADGDIEGALRNLRSYIYAHMNTNLNSGNSIKPPIQLKYRYDRLLQTEKDRAKTSSGNVYNDAQHYCEKKYPTGFYGASRLPCIRKYVSSHSINIKVQSVPESLYKFDFVSPAWTPDLAGWSMVLTILLFVMFALRLGLEKWVKHDLASS